MSESEFLAGYRARMMAHALRRIGRLRFRRVLDIGCSDGQILRTIARVVRAETAVGVDLNAAEGESDGILFRKCNLFDYSAEEPFDLVISNQVFEHIYEPWLPKYFDVLKASCSPTGVILLSTPNRWRALNLVRFLTFRRPYMMQANPGVPPSEHLGHHRECSYRELAALLRGAFDRESWHMTIVRSVPRDEGSRLRWLARCAVYLSLWPFGDRSSSPPPRTTTSRWSTSPSRRSGVRSSTGSHDVVEGLAAPAGGSWNRQNERRNSARRFPSG